MRLPFRLLLGLGFAALTGCCTPWGYSTAYVGRPLPCNRCTAATPLPPAYTAAPLPVTAAPLPVTAPANPPVVALGPPHLPNTESNFAPPVSGDPPFPRFNPDNNGRLYPPVQDRPAADAPPQAKLLPPQSLAKTPEPLLAKPTEEPPVLPADIPNFAVVKKGIAAGQQPFPEGVTWLKDHGYKTVLHVRPPPTQPDTSAKGVFESHGLAYINLEVSPTTLTKEVVTRFNEVVADEKNQPLFVYDKDSTLAGALWYLYFRTAEGLSDEKARAESSRLGFKQDQDDKSRDMWIAVQNYLRSQNP